MYILILQFQAHSKALNIFLPKEFLKRKKKPSSLPAFLEKPKHTEEILLDFPEGNQREGQHITENTGEGNRGNIL